jgi:hypothetical protein
MSTNNPVGDMPEEEKNRLNAEYVEWFEHRQAHQDDENPPYRNEATRIWHEEQFNSHRTFDEPPHPIKSSKLYIFFADLIGTLVAVGLLMILFFL